MTHYAALALFDIPILILFIYLQHGVSSATPESQHINAFLENQGPVGALIIVLIVIPTVGVYLRQKQTCEIVIEKYLQQE